MALLDNSKPTSQEISLKNGVLRTNGALAHIQAPSNWLARFSSKRIQPGMPNETFFFFKKDESSKTSIGVYFSGIIADEFDGNLLKQEIFDQKIDMTKGSPEATRYKAAEGAYRNTTNLTYALISTAPHAVHTQESDCLSFRTTEFKGMKAAVIECENAQFDTRSLEYCIDVLGNGQVIYSLYYRAPIANFAEQSSLAQETFESTIWRTDFNPTVNLDAVT